MLSLSSNRLYTDLLTQHLKFLPIALNGAAEVKQKAVVNFGLIIGCAIVGPSCGVHSSRD